ncbi:phosphotransferase family protein [Qipengyuania soli]|uniref:Phosphotransferase n=1 Tax=Qipengyuania soli TaxID=2782568 RepID=A0A7S8IVR5_9SPHN|nr:phosphotransferase [Qipengyuania soli]QPC99930.1 phosphotransferase [Qipengyuania soli]
MVSFPAHPDDVTPQWLGEVLDAEVRSVSWKPIGTGQVGDSVRFTLEADGAPRTLAGKFPAADAASRGTAIMFGLYRKEVEFYRQTAPHLEVRVPNVHFADVSEDGGEFILLFEDVGPARQGDQIAGCGIEDARHAMRQAAAIHAPSWGREDLLQAAWIQPPASLGETIAGLYPQAQAVFRERYADSLEPELMRICEELAEAAPIWFHRTEPPKCIVHGDFRLDNMLFDIGGGAEPIAVLDWQTVTIGNALTDVAYFMGCGIGEKLWRDNEDELLDLWLAEMTAHGVELTREEVWDDYRRGVLHGVSTAVFSAAFVERTARGDDNFLSMARGSCSLALARDSIGALKETI